MENSHAISGFDPQLQDVKFSVICIYDRNSSVILINGRIDKTDIARTCTNNPFKQILTLDAVLRAYLVRLFSKLHHTEVAHVELRGMSISGYSLLQRPVSGRFLK